MPQELPKGVNPDLVKLINNVFYDLCVDCRKVTSVRTDCPIEQRRHYVEGSGQLCEDCFHKTSAE